jgi:hypothetical protein
MGAISYGDLANKHRLKAHLAKEAARVKRKAAANRKFAAQNERAAIVDDAHLRELRNINGDR